MWNKSSDPELEEAFASIVKEIVNNLGPLPDIVCRKVSRIDRSFEQSSFDKVG